MVSTAHIHAIFKTLHKCHLPQHLHRGKCTFGGECMQQHAKYHLAFSIVLQKYKIDHLSIPHAKVSDWGNRTFSLRSVFASRTVSTKSCKGKFEERLLQSLPAIHTLQPTWKNRWQNSHPRRGHLKIWTGSPKTIRRLYTVINLDRPGFKHLLWHSHVGQILFPHKWIIW